MCHFVLRHGYSKASLILGREKYSQRQKNKEYLPVRILSIHHNQQSRKVERSSSTLASSMKSRRLEAVLVPRTEFLIIVQIEGVACGG